MEITQTSAQNKMLILIFNLDRQNFKVLTVQSETEVHLDRTIMIWSESIHGPSTNRPGSVRTDIIL